MVEGGVIVVSILLAFAVDALWSEAQERREVSGELQGVAQELRRNKELLQFQIDFSERASRATSEVVTVLGSSTTILDVELSDSLVLFVISDATFDPSLGALDALIASGRMALVENDELRLRLSGLRGLVEDAVELQLESREAYRTQMLPHLSNDTSLDYYAVADLAEVFWEGSERPASRSTPKERSSSRTHSRSGSSSGVDCCGLG